MSKINPNLKSGGSKIDTRLAGSSGAKAARQDAEALLRRAVFACLLWEDMAYETGAANADNIAALIPQVAPEIVAQIAVDARVKQKLRHVPLYILSEMLKYDKHRALVAGLIPQIVTRPDQMTDLLAIYWKKGKAKLANQLKKGLAACFNKFNEYSLGKYDRDGAIKLRDVMFMVHPKPVNDIQKELFAKVASRTLAIPDTWEVALSTGKDKKETWERLINEGKLGAMALLRNLRNMKEVNVASGVIRKGLREAKAEMLLPLNFLGAAVAAPEYKTDINELMLRTYSNLPKLKGKTIFIIDVSGSMNQVISSKSQFMRWQVAAMLAVLALEQCEDVEIWCTGGSHDHASAHIMHPSRGFDLIEQVGSYLYQGKNSLGGNGIFTAKCLAYVKSHTNYTPDRIMVFSDSQDVDYDSKIPQPFGKNNYIIDVSAHKHGVNYKNVWSAEIAGWSENFLSYVAVSEGVDNQFDESVSGS